MWKIKKFRLFPNIPSTNDMDLTFKEYYQNWRVANSNLNAPFIAIFNSFKETHLKDIDPGPLKLYLFFCFAANNDYGHSWHSIQSIADFFGKQTRTINDWIKVLVERDLIYRDQTNKKSHTTFLIPYSNTLIAHKPPHKRDTDQEVIDDIIELIKSRGYVYGEIVNVIHLFQWKKDKKQKYLNVQFVIIITKRGNGILIGHWYRLKKSKDLCISESKVQHVAYFESSFKYNNKNIYGFALSNGIFLPKMGVPVEILGLIEDFVDGEEWQIKELPIIYYGNKTDVLSEEDLEEETDTDEGEQDEDKEE